MKKEIKDLQLNPQDHEIELSADFSSVATKDDLPMINGKFGDTDFSMCFNSIEAKKVGEWFISLSARIK
jgi:hypothetical protein